MPEKIYFCGSIRGGRSDREIYAGLIQHISKYATVLTEHIGDPLVGADHELTDKQIHDRDLKWLQESDLVIAEVSQTSLGVGYEIGRAIEMKKPIVCLYRSIGDQRLSAMIAGSSAIRTFHYSTLDEAIEILNTIL